MATLEHFVLNVDRPEWMQEAACRNLPVDIFFPTRDSNGWDNLRAAVAICETCPVIEQCLKYALSFGYRALPGIWGGTSENQRRAMLYSDAPIR